MGFEFSIDDFGTGYSSFENLKQLPIDMLKIDRSFIRGLGNGDLKDQAIVQAMIIMGNCLGIKILARVLRTSTTSKY